MLNDWSARDLQAWEYVPARPVSRQVLRHLDLGLGAAAGSAGRRTRPAGAASRSSPLSAPAGGRGYDIDVEVEINGQLVSTCPYAGMYYSPAQMLAHLTVNGAHLRTGDLYGSGHHLGPGRDQRGSLLELTWNGAEPIDLGAHGLRTFLLDGDEVVLRAVSRDHRRLGSVRFAARLADCWPHKPQQDVTTAAISLSS